MIILIVYIKKSVEASYRQERDCVEQHENSRTMSSGGCYGIARLFYWCQQGEIRVDGFQGCRIRPALAQPQI